MLVEVLFQLVFENHILINPSTTYSAVSVLVCANLCRVPCSSFFFNPAQHQCALSTIHYEETHPDIKSEMGWNYYSSSGDADECTAGSDNCHGDATCTNTAGSFTCACNAGYNGDGVTCTDADECSAESDNCHAEATCANNVGSFTCSCNAGYNGDGVNCEDADECTDRSNNCHADATCTNTVGSFTCACNAGFNGDGVTCTENQIPPGYTLMTTENLLLKVETVNTRNFTDAIAACAADGAHLFHLDTTAKINAWKQVHSNYYGGRVFWLGLSDYDYAANDFRWTDGTPYTDHNWKPGQPDNVNGRDDCVIISPSDSYMWKDMYCTDFERYVCEIDQI